MVLRFGRTVFGGSAVGLVSAAGIALCSAQAQGYFNTIHPSGGIVEVLAQAESIAFRQTSAGVSPSSATASATGSPEILYAGSGVSSAKADAVAVLNVQVQYSAYGWVMAEATLNGSMFRYAKARGHAANAAASAEAEGFVSQIGAPSPALANAWGFGTTYYVGGSTAEAAASLLGSASQQVGADGAGYAQSSASAVCVHEHGGAGVGTAVGFGSGEPAVQVEGIRYFTATGFAECTAAVENTFIGIHQAQTGWATALASGKGNFQIGVRGSGIATAVLLGDGLAASTAATAISGDSSSTATGVSKLLAKAKGSAAGVAIGSGSAVTVNTKTYGAVAGATCSATQVIATKVTITKVYPGVGYGVAALNGRQYRTVSVYPLPSGGSASASNNRNIRTDVGYGVAVARAVITAAGTKIRNGSSSATAVASLQATVQYGVSPLASVAVSALQISSIRAHFSIGYGNAVATGIGANQVNDLVPAPGERTLYSLMEQRTITVELDNRVLII